MEKPSKRKYLLIFLKLSILFRSHVQRMVTNDLTTTNVSSNPTTSSAALKMYLYACKLLDVLLTMPYSELYHFQL